MYSVLLVDDERYARKGLINIIDWAKCGFAVPDEADNGEDALALIERRHYDLVITDIRMPVLDGLALIRTARETLAETPAFIIISGYDDFKYAQQAVRYGVMDFILKPIDETQLEATLQKLRERLQQDKLVRAERNQLLHSSMMAALIKGEAAPETIPVMMQLLGVSQSEILHYALIEVNDLHPWRTGGKLPSQHQLLDQIRDALKAFQRNESEAYVHIHRNRYGFVITSSQIVRSGYPGLSSYAESMQRALSAHLGETVYIYVGQPVQELTLLSDSYRTAREALQYKYARDDSKVVIYDEVRELSLNHVDLEGSLYKQLEEHIEEHNLDAIHSDIEELFGQFRKKRYVPEAVKLAIHHCVAGVVKLARGMGIDEKEIASLEPIVSWQDLNMSLDALQRLFTEFIVESSERITSGRKETMRGNIQKVKNYIEANFRDNISLKGIAAQFYMNPVYLGQLFKRTYGVYFNDFLLEIRIAEAKKLLRQTDKRIYEIAEEVGFNNADYFVTQFEKLEKMTPTEYRNSIL